MKNPLQFLLRAATIYPHKLAISHPDVESPVCYTYSVWYDFLFFFFFSLFLIFYVFTPHRAQRVQNLAYALIWYGIKPGDKVAVISPNTLVISLYSSGLC